MNKTIETIQGIGPSTGNALRRAGVNTVNELRNRNPDNTDHNKLKTLYFIQAEALGRRIDAPSGSRYGASGGPCSVRTPVG